MRSQRVVIGVEQKRKVLVEQAVSGEVRLEDERLEKPTRMREVPLGGTCLRHRLHHLIFCREGVGDGLSGAANRGVALKQRQGVAGRKQCNGEHVRYAHTTSGQQFRRTLFSNAGAERLRTDLWLDSLICPAVSKLRRFSARHLKDGPNALPDQIQTGTIYEVGCQSVGMNAKGILGWGR